MKFIFFNFLLSITKTRNFNIFCLCNLYLTVAIILTHDHGSITSIKYSIYERPINLLKFAYNITNYDKHREKHRKIKKTHENKKLKKNIKIIYYIPQTTYHFLLTTHDLPLTTRDHSSSIIEHLIYWQS